VRYIIASYLFSALRYKVFYNTSFLSHPTEYIGDGVQDRNVTGPVRIETAEEIGNERDAANDL